MMRIKLIELVSQIKSESALLKRNTIQQICRTPKYSTNSKNNTTYKEEDELDKPIVFSKSPAATAPIEHTRMRSTKTTRIQGTSLTWSVAAFLLYFCVLREENDIDEKLVQGVSPEMQEYLYGAKAYELRKNMKPMQ